MNRDGFISGSIFEFKLPVSLGYGYSKVLDFRNIREMDGLLIKVFDCIVELPIDNLNFLADKQLLFGPRRLYKVPNTKGKGAWKFKGVLIADDDFVIPEFKYAPKASPLIDDESSIKEWYVNRNLVDVSYDKKYSYDQVKHLEDKVVSSQYGIEIRTAMEILRKQEKDIGKYFDLNALEHKNVYRQMVNVPIYSTIPKILRGKAISY